MQTRRVTWGSHSTVYSHHPFRRLSSLLDSSNHVLLCPGFPEVPIQDTRHLRITLSALTQVQSTLSVSRA